MKIQFMGFLSNADSSILKLKLKKGFKICSIPEKDGIKLIATFDNTSLPQAYHGISHCINSSEKKMYYIDNSFESNIEKDREGRLTNFPTEPEFKDFKEYGDEITRLMRLFKEGDIRMAKSYYLFKNDNNNYSNFITTSGILPISTITTYHLEDSELAELEDFIDKTRLPFNLPDLQLAFESFEESYNIHNKGLSFLTLMIALEVLFSPSDTKELNYRISRNIAVLLGKTLNESKIIFKEIQELYSKRCKIAHEGKFNFINQESLLSLREYVRKAIRKRFLFVKNKKDLLGLLHSNGFGTNLVEEN